MFDPTQHLLILRLLSYLDRLKAKLRRSEEARYGAERNQAAFYERAWREAAEAIGAAIEAMGNDLFRVRMGERTVHVTGNVTPLDDLVTHVMVRTKPVAYRVLAQLGLPVPRHATFELRDMTPAVRFMQTLDGPSVVKPAAGTGGGKGVTTGIRTRWQLARAAYLAAAYAQEMLIEQQIPGDNWRLLFLDGQLLDAVIRRPPRATGDGRSTVQQLVDAINTRRLNSQAGVSHVVLGIDLDMQRSLERQGMTLSSVPAEGQTVILKTVINENSAEDNEPAMKLICPAIVDDAARAVKALGVRLAGVDMITRDPTVALRESGGVILEVNNPPGFFWHYHTNAGAFPVAQHVLAALFGLPCPATAWRNG